MEREMMLNNIGHNYGYACHVVHTKLCNRNEVTEMNERKESPEKAHVNWSQPGSSKWSCYLTTTGNILKQQSAKKSQGHQIIN